MLRARERTKNAALSVAGGIALGAAVTLLLSPGPTPALAAAQDPAIQMQIQQAMNNLRISLQSRLDMMQAEIDNVERNLDNLGYRFQTAEINRAGQTAPLPIDPIPGTPTFGRLVSEETQAQRFVLQDAAGRLLAQLGMTADGPGLLLFDLDGAITAALVSTPAGPELRMVDADGVLQTVVPERR